MNIVLLSGKLISSPKLERTKGGRAVCSFILESHAGRFSDGSDKRQTHKICFFGAEAEYCFTHLTFGLQVYLEGRLTNARRGIEVVGNQLRLLDEKNEEKDGALHG